MHQNFTVMEEKKIDLRIKDILHEKGITAKSLAESMGKAPQYLNSIINGGKGASLNTLQEIAKVLDVPMAALFADYKPEIVDHPIVCPKCGTKLIVKVEQDHDE